MLFRSRRARGLFRVEPGSAATGDDLGPEWRERQQDEDDEGPAVSDPRSRAQQDFDSLFEVIDAGLRAEQDGHASTAVTHEVVVQITAADLEAREGQGWTSGVLAGLPVPVIERKACTGGVRLLVTGVRGEPLHLGRVQRLFTSAQKKALLVAAGGRCQYPGCRVPGPFLEAHHAAWFHRDHGPTDVENGVMLCSFHHHLVHASSSPVEIRRHDGALHLVPRGWRGPPDPAQRLRTGPPLGPPAQERDPGDPWAA